MNKQKGKEKKNHTFLKLIIAISLLGLAFYGVLQLDGGFQARLDNSYKIKTEKNKKYNGIYSLTKLDENGNNTWDGLWLYVEKDEILAAVKYEMMTHEEMCDKFNKDMYLTREEFNKTDKSSEIISKYTMTLEDSYEDYVGGYLYDIEYNNVINKYHLSDWTDRRLFSGTRTQSKIIRKKIYGIEWSRFQLLSKEQRNELDFSSMYSDIKSCGINASYDEDSNQLWLSKLLSNPESEYSSNNYKLIRHKTAASIDNCPYLDGGFTFEVINEYK